MTNESNQNYAVGNNENRVNGDFTISPLTTSIDIKTLRQLMGSWHTAGISDSRMKKMLTLYFGEPAWMDMNKTYPYQNFYNMAKDLNFHSKTELLDMVIHCKGFGYIWKNNNMPHIPSNLLAFYTPIWHVAMEESEETESVSNAQEDLAADDGTYKNPTNVARYNSLYDNIYKKKNNKKKNISKYVSALHLSDSATQQENINAQHQQTITTQQAITTTQQQQVITAAAQQLIRYIATNTDAYAKVVKPINEMTLQLMPELPFDPSSSCPATDATVRFINEHLYPYILQHGERLMHIRTLLGQSCWLANLIKKDFMMKKISIAVNDTRRYLARHPQERLRANRSDNGLEYQDPETGQRFYDTLLPDGTRKQHRIPQEAPPREQPDTVWSKHQKAWVKEIKP